MDKVTVLESGDVRCSELLEFDEGEVNVELEFTAPLAYCLIKEIEGASPERVAISLPAKELDKFAQAWLDFRAEQ